MAIPNFLKRNPRKKRNATKGSRVAYVQETLDEIGRIKGISRYKVCDLLKIPRNESDVNTKQISGYNSRAKEYLRKLKIDINNASKYNGRNEDNITEPRGTQ